MTVPVWLTKAAMVLTAVSVAVLLVASPLYVFVSPAFVRHEYSRPGFPDSVRFAANERLRISDALVNYLRGTTTEAEMVNVETDAGQIAMRPEESQHIIDVKVVTDGFFGAHRIAVAGLLLALLALWRSPERNVQIGMGLRGAFWVVAALIALVIVSSFIDFDTFFTRFHQMFFASGSWLFYEEDTLIQLYPLVFWSDAVLKIGVTIAVETIALFGISHWLMRN